MVKGSSIDLINKTTGKPLALTSIKGQLAGSEVLRRLGLYEFVNTKSSQQAVTVLTKSIGEITQLSAKAEGPNMVELPVIVQQVDESVALMLRGFDTPIEGSELSLCELQGLDKAMQTYRGY